MRAQATPRCLFVVATAGTLGLVAVADLTPAVQIALLTPLVAGLGVPHGALDIDMARALWPLERRAARLAFGLGYLAVAAAVLGLWLVAPAVALTAFLVYSAAHFAGDWREALVWPARLVAGAAVVALPAARHEAAVGQLFAVLAPADAAGALASVLHALAPLAAAAAIGLAAVARRPGVVLELATLALLALAAPPLVYFAVYFCGLHSPRHFVETLDRLDLGWWRGVASALPLTLVTLALAGLAAAVLAARGDAPDVVALKTVFAGLAALAVPHMVLVERFWTRR